jgi:hypothetical protein
LFVKILCLLSFWTALAQCYSVNFVVFHQSPNKRYELIAIPESDACGTYAEVFVRERKTKKLLYSFQDDWDTEYLYILSDNGETVLKFETSIWTVRDPQIQQLFVRKNGIVSDTINSARNGNFRYLVKDKSLLRDIPKSRKRKISSRRTYLECTQDTLRFIHTKKDNPEVFVHYYSWNFDYLGATSLTVTDYNNSQVRYQRVYYRLEFLDYVRREKLRDAIKGNKGLK